MSDYQWSHVEPLAPRHDRTAEQWLRAVWQDSGLGPVLRVGWRYGLGLRLGPRDDESQILGWAIAAMTDDEVAVSAESAVLVTTNTVALATDSLTWTTTVDYANAAGRALWKPASLMHQATVPLTIRRAVRAASAPH